MRTPMDIIKGPYIKEKTASMTESGWYTFTVAVKSTKTEIKNAVQKLFNVEVMKVNTINCIGKKKRSGVHLGKRADWKKAYVKINKKYKTSIEEYGVNN